jgi:hypothetical protein
MRLLGFNRRRRVFTLKGLKSTHLRELAGGFAPLRTAKQSDLRRQATGSSGIVAFVQHW